MDGNGSEKKYDITTYVRVRPSPIDAMDSERIGNSIGVDDGRWTNTVRPLAAVAIGVVVGLAVASSSSRDRWSKEHHHNQQPRKNNRHVGS